MKTRLDCEGTPRGRSLYVSSHAGAQHRRAIMHKHVGAIDFGDRGDRLYSISTPSIDRNTRIHRVVLLPPTLLSTRLEILGSTGIHAPLHLPLPLASLLALIFR